MPSLELGPATTYAVLLLVQALHLLHHRLARQHISAVEVLTAAVLCLPPTAPLPPALLVGLHLALATILALGSLALRRLAPRHDGKPWLPGYG